MVEGVRPVDPVTLADHGGWDRDAVVGSLSRLATGHRLALDAEGAVWMAHPFSAVETGYAAVIGDRRWDANCAWDALAILSLLGDGCVEGPGDLNWEVSDGSVEPKGLVHLLVPAREFWEDIGFT